MLIFRLLRSQSNTFRDQKENQEKVIAVNVVEKILLK